MHKNVLSLKSFKIFQSSKSIDANFKCGTITAVFGRNGAGKTMFIKSVAGLYKQYQGGLVRGYTDDEIGILLQIPEDLIFREYAFDEAMIFGGGELEANKLLSEIGVHRDQRSLSLSDGQKRMLFINGIMNQKSVMIFDEPFASLDKTTKSEMIKKMQEHRTAGKTIIYTANRKADLTAADCVVEI